MNNHIIFEDPVFPLKAIQWDNKRINTNVINSKKQVSTNKVR